MYNYRMRLLSSLGVGAHYIDVEPVETALNDTYGVTEAFRVFKREGTAEAAAAFLVTLEATYEARTNSGPTEDAIALRANLVESATT